jgi:hypothetical protein
MLQRALVVDTSKSWLEKLGSESGNLFELVPCSDFHSARKLIERGPSFLITNIQLAAYNGLHLVHIAAQSQLQTRCIVYSDEIDRFLFREAQNLRAFCETRARLVQALSAYCGATLPVRDRRDVQQWDRRAQRRGGRRAADFSDPKN